MGEQSPSDPLGILFDRDGTLVEDVPYNGDPDLVRPMPYAQQAVAALRRAGIPTGVVSNQSGIARGLLSRGQVDAVNARVDDLLGPFDVWCVCPHGTEDGCGCRKPRPGLIHQAARALDIPADRLAVVGDIAADIDAAAAAGCTRVLVPTPATRSTEVKAAPAVAANLVEALRLLFADGSAVRRALDSSELNPLAENGSAAQSTGRFSIPLGGRP